MFAKYIPGHGRFAFSDTDNGGIEISLEYYNELFDGQSQGRAIVSDGNDYPINKVPVLDDLKNEKRFEIKSDCDSAILVGIDHDALGTVYHYPTNRDDQANLNGLVSKSILLGDAGGPYKFWCADANGAWVRRNHTSAQIQAVGLAVAAHVIAAQDNYALKLSDIDAAENEEDLALVSWD